MSSAFILYGIQALRKVLSFDEEYDFREDFNDCFFTMSFGAGGKPKKNSRIHPIMWIVVGLGILVIGLIKLL